MTGGYFLWMFALLCAGLFAGGRVAKAPGRFAEGEPLEPWRAFLPCLTLTVSFLAELRIVSLAAETQVPFPAWFANLPLLLIDENPPLHGHTPAWVGNGLLVLALIQALALYRFFFVVRSNAPNRTVVAIAASACAIMLVAALATRRMAAGIDLYLNVGYGQLGLGAYAPPALAFPDEFVAINRLWGVPILPATYGPLWLLLAKAIAQTGHSLAAQLQAFRIAGALAFLGCIPLLRAAGARAAEVAVFALNPALIFAFVVDAHNDIFPLALALAALATGARRPFVALAFAVAAGSMKLPFALAACLAFAQLDDRRRRVGFCVATIVLALAMTELGSGGRYVASASHALAYQRLTNPWDNIAHALAIGAALVATGLAIWQRRFIATASWTFLSLGAVVLPWYAAWGLPYAIVQRTFLPLYLITLPVLAFGLSTTFGPTFASRLLYVAIVCTPLVYILWRPRTAPAGA